MSHCQTYYMYVVKTRILVHEKRIFLRNLSENSWTLFRWMFLDLSLEILLANIHKKYLSRIKKTYLTLIIFQQTCFCLIQDIVIYLIWSFLQKTAFAKSSILEIYLTDSQKFASDWEIHLMNIKTKTMYIKLKLRIC